MSYKIFLLLILASVVFISCEDSSSNPDYSYIKNPKERWQAYKLLKYTIDQQRLCFCPYIDKISLAISNDSIIEARNTSDNSLLDEENIKRYKTINQLFDYIDTLKARNVDSLYVEYDSTYGYPSKIYIDFERYMVDEELFIYTNQLKPGFFKEK